MLLFSTRLFLYLSIVVLTFDLKINRVHPFVIVNMPAKFDNDVHICITGILHKTK